MAQLTLKDIYEVADGLLHIGENLEDYPVYIGDDDELNGIHNAWYTNVLFENDEDSQQFIELINENFNGTKFDKKAILIS